MKLGKNVKVSDFTNLYDCEIGDNTFIGPFVEIQKGAKVGKNCRIQSHVFICSDVVLDDDVFVGHGAMFVNDKYPRSNNPNWKCLKTRVGKNASIGTNATILPVNIGDWAMIGAGAVVTRNVPNGETFLGNPARKYETAR